ncbi:MAG: conserved membrane protein of unknown function [Promethearchaeota archaeon]|nr:MAG: conserved membrane protein of unknown function [Candidatus Lokiarchaeota archaeon]
MNKLLDKYIDFCKRFSNSNLPELKFRTLTDNYLDLYHKRYNIEQRYINKATTCIFTVLFLAISIISLLVINISFLIIIFYSLLISLISSYQFNSFLYWKIKKIEQNLNSVLYFIKIDFSLIQKASITNTDYYIKFITLIANYDLSISKDFSYMLSEIHCGIRPETSLRSYISPSLDFNLFLKNLLVKNFSSLNPLEKTHVNTLEDDFKVYLKEITSKLSILFFIGIFVPIGLSFGFFFISVSKIFMLIVVPFFYAFINYLFKKFMKKNHFLIGMIKNNSEFEQKILNEFLVLIEKFAFNLNRNQSPERAFLTAFISEKSSLQTISSVLYSEINKFFNGISTFMELLILIKKKLKSVRYSIVISSIITMIQENSYYAASKIIEIVKIFRKHQALQNKVNILIKGEKFKTFVFLILLPLIIGSIGALIPFLPSILTNLFELNEFTFGTINQSSLEIMDVISILITFLITNSISSYYFLSIINIRNKFFIMAISDIIFILTYLLSVLNVMNFIM